MEYNTDLGQFDIKLIRGVNETIRYWDFKKLDDTGKTVPWDLTGKTVRIHFKSDINNEEPDLEKTVANGGIVIDENSLDLKFGSETLNLKKDVYLYDLLVIENADRYTLVQGKLILTGVITK
ncbi:hypothetical protein [Sphingobacterium multivorum]|uniref:hypothetical protein n=1 Tax=Sphingobacterium multivorum TaxID=28454 RepID=UPI0030170261